MTEEAVTSVPRGEEGELHISTEKANLKRHQLSMDIPFSLWLKYVVLGTHQHFVVDLGRIVILHSHSHRVKLIQTNRVSVTKEHKITKKP